MYSTFSCIHVYTVIVFSGSRKVLNFHFTCRCINLCLLYYCSPTLGMTLHFLYMSVKWGKKITVYNDLYFSKMFKHLSFRYFVCYDPYVFCFSVCLYCSKYNYNLQVEINPACFVLYYILFCFFTLEYRV